MLKKVLLGALLLILLLSIGLFLWVRAVFTEDTVRTALADQLSKALGQPVRVAKIAATIYPRVTVNLRQVTIGEPARIRVETLHVGADFGALLSRRIEHARLELSGAQVELPLPDFSIGSGSTSGSSSKPPVEIVSIDEIVLRDVDIVSGGRTLTGDVEIVPEAKGLTLRRVALLADKAKINATGRITDLSGPVGEVTIKAGALNFDRLLAFATDFATGTGMRSSARARSTARPATNPNAAQTGAPPMDIAVSLDADRATMGTLALDKLAGNARITADRMTLDPVSFAVFGGRYDGALVFTLGAVPDFKLNARVAGVDMAAATAFAGSRGTITGRLSGTLNLAGRGMDASVMNTTRGTARINIADGVIKNLGLVRSVVVATSGRADSAGAGGGARDEPFTRLGATLAIAGGSATTDDLRFESKDLLLAAAGNVRLDGSAINLRGQVQLSDELSRQAGRDLVRYTQEGGRVTLPATITGSADAPQVRVDMAGLAKRALTNRAKEEAQKALKKGLGGLFKR
jgi:uncharacterized protein involved in outer membrane biogenesis